MLGPVETVDEIDSTNRVLLERARAGEPHGRVLVADHQTAGRGRLGRAWEAPPGASLLASVLLRPDLEVADASLVTMAAGLAAVDACSGVAGVRPTLKWPNDLVIDRPDGTRKLAGLLAESLVEGGRLAALVVGIGLNVNWPHPLPAALDGIATALNHETGHDIDRRTVLEAWLGAFAHRYDRLDRGVIDDYRSACSTLGRRVRVERHDDVLEGMATDIDEAGRLLVEMAGTVHTVTIGDVVHLRPI